MPTRRSIPLLFYAASFLQHIVIPNPLPCSYLVEALNLRVRDLLLVGRCETMNSRSLGQNRPFGMTVRSGIEFIVESSSSWNRTVPTRPSIPLLLYAASFFNPLSSRTRCHAHISRSIEFAGEGSAFVDRHETTNSRSLGENRPFGMTIHFGNRVHRGIECYQRDLDPFGCGSES